MTISRTPYPQLRRHPPHGDVGGTPMSGTRDVPGPAGEEFAADPGLKTYLITYAVDDETDDDGRDLGTLYSALQSLDACARVFRSVWIVQTGLTTGELMQEVSPLLSDNDKLLIVECGQGAEWRGLRLDVSVWLQDLLAENSGPKTSI